MTGLEVGLLMVLSVVLITAVVAALLITWVLLNVWLEG